MSTRYENDRNKKRKVEQQLSPQKRRKSDPKTAISRNVIKNVDPDVKRLKTDTGDLMRISSKQYIFKYDPSDLHTRVDGKRIGIVGASGSGKSRLLLQLARFHKNIPAWCILNPSESANHMYEPYVENVSVIHERDDIKEMEKILMDFKKRQISRCKKWSVPNTDPVEFDPDPSVGLILDDLCSDTKLFNFPIFGWLYNNSRNFKVWVAFLVQYLFLFPKKYRRQFSHVFLFSMASIDDIKEAWKAFGGSFENFGDFKKAFKLATENRGTLVLKMPPSNKIEESVFWYKHEMKQPPFKLGAEWFNKQVRQKYNPNWEDDLETANTVEKVKPEKKTKAKSKKDEEMTIELI
jgi:energy-coupling factor transporter ATP-binding protein EcfA2